MENLFKGNAGDDIQQFTCKCVDCLSFDNPSQFNSNYDSDVSDIDEVCSEDNEDTLQIFENILNSVHPGRTNNGVSSRSATDIDGQDFSNELRLIRQNISSLVNCLTNPNSVDGTESDVSSANKASTLTESMISDKLLHILHVDEDDVKTKIAVVIEMLVKNDVVNPSVFCDKRFIDVFKNVLSSKDRRYLKTTLVSLYHFISGLGRKGIFFGLVKVEDELKEILKTIKNQGDIEDSISPILDELDSLLFLYLGS